MKNFLTFAAGTTILATVLIAGIVSNLPAGPKEPNMTTKISFLITDEIAEQMTVQSPKLFFDVFGKVQLQKSDDWWDREVVGSWWKE